MNEVVLVTGSETLTGRKLIEKLLAQGSQVVVPVAGQETEIKDTGTPNLTVLSWNRSSWFSTKAVIREVIQRFRKIDSAWVLHQPTGQTDIFSDSGSSQIEKVLELSVKGNVAMVRELVPLLENSAGFLGIVVPYRSGGTVGPLESLSAGAFTGFTTSLFRETASSLWSCGFFCSSPDAEGFTDNIIRLREEKPDKLRNQWFRYAEGRRPFGGSTIVRTLS
jgi:NAD(P)-dependent dehydrogenase (short-subunit alcohol dehydrogenase family)